MDQLQRHVAQKSKQILAIFVMGKHILILTGCYFFETFLQLEYFGLKLVILHTPFYTCGNTYTICMYECMYVYSGVVFFGSVLVRLQV